MVHAIEVQLELAQSIAQRLPANCHLDQLVNPSMSDYLSAHELADLVGCKHNQRSIMIRWLERNNWTFVVDKNGIPKVMRTYRDRKLGIIDSTSADDRYDATPNLDVFKSDVAKRKR